MLSKKVFKDKMQDLIDFYPSWGIKIDNSQVIAKWYDKFRDYTDEQFSEAVNKHIETVAFNPTVATLKENTSKSNEKIIDGIRYIGGLKVYE